MNRRLVHLSRVSSFLVLAMLGTACADATGTTPAGPDFAAPALASNAPSRAAASDLLTCTVAEAASGSAVIGPEGGVLSAGGHSIAIPRGAVKRPTTFVLTVPASPYVEVSITAGDRQHYRFSRPAVITLDYSRCGSDVDALGGFTAWYVEHNSKAFLGDMGGVDDRLNQRLYFATDHLSGYAVAF